MSAHRLSRRTFMKSSLTTAAAASMAGPVLGALGANERIRVGVIGTGGRGNYHVRMFKPNPSGQYHQDAEVIALCDVDQRHLDRTAAEVPGARPQVFKDFRHLLDMREVDAVIVASPCHWHGLHGLHALKAGKDLFIEKPIGHTIEEGRLIIEAAGSTGRIVQVGQQQRSVPHWQNAVQRIREGELGQVTTVNVWNVWTLEGMGGKLGNPPDGDPPEGVDYDLWLGPAPKRPFNPARFHFGFYFFWDYSSGMVCAWGVHLFDVVNWALGATLKSAAASGGIYVLKDARETPDTLSAVFDCGNYVMSYQMRHTNGFQPFGLMLHGDMDHGIEFVGTKGLLHINRGGYQMYHAADRDTRKPYYDEKATGNDTYRHQRNFFDCIRSRKPPAVPAEAGQAAAVPGYLANISYRVGRSVRWDAEKNTIIGDAEAAKLLTKDYRAPWTLEV
jgi:predicted dehydrogenase